MLSRLIAFTLLCSFALQVPCIPGAEDGKNAREVLNRAIAAMGGVKRLSSEKALTGSSRGTAYVQDQKSAVKNEWTVQGLDQVRWASEVTLNDNPARILIVINGSKGWISGNDQPGSEIAREQLVAFGKAFRALRLVEVLVPLTSKEWKLSSLGELKIGTRMAVGLKATQKGSPDLDIYFDAKTYFPLKLEMRLTETSGNDIGWSAEFNEYEKFGERHHFTKMTVTRDGKVVLEMERSNIKAKERVDDETFAKP